jgi:hypothetical protein
VGCLACLWLGVVCRRTFMVSFTPKWMSEGTRKSAWPPSMPHPVSVDTLPCRAGEGEPRGVEDSHTASPRHREAFRRCALMCIGCVCGRPRTWSWWIASGLSSLRLAHQGPLPHVVAKQEDSIG